MTRVSLTGFDTIGVGCDMTGGSSGGPWILGLGRGNYINGLISYGYDGGTEGDLRAVLQRRHQRPALRRGDRQRVRDDLLTEAVSRRRGR